MSVRVIPIFIGILSRTGLKTEKFILDTIPLIKMSKIHSNWQILYKLKSGLDILVPRSWKWKAKLLSQLDIFIFRKTLKHVLGFPKNKKACISMQTFRVKWGEQDSNLRRRSQQIYSLPSLAAWVSPQNIFHYV